MSGVGWCVHLPEILFPLLSPHDPTCVPVLMVRPPSRGLVSHCLAACVPVGCCVRLPEVLPPLSPINSTHVCLSWIVRPPSRGLVSLSSIMSHCLPTCVPVLDGASAFRTSCLPLTPHISACVGGCARLPEVLSALVFYSSRICADVRCCVRLPEASLVSHRMVCLPSQGLFSLLVSHYLPLSPHMCACIGWCVRLPDVLSSLDSPHVCLRWPMCPPSRGLICLVF